MIDPETGQGVPHDDIEPGSFREVSEEEGKRAEIEYYEQQRREGKLEINATTEASFVEQYLAFIASPEYGQLKQAKVGEPLDMVHFASGADFSLHEAFGWDNTNDRCWYIDIDEKVIASLKREFENPLHPVPNHRAILKPARDFRLPDKKQIDVVIARDATKGLFGDIEILPLVSHLADGGFVIVSGWGNAK